VRNTCEIIHLLTDSNPIQVIVDAIINRSVAPVIRKTPSRTHKLPYAARYIGLLDLVGAVQT